MRLLASIGLFLVLFSCELQLQEIPAPDDLLPEEKIVLILEDLMVTEQYIQMKYPQPDYYLEVAKHSGDAILKKHGVTFKQFDSSLNYYGSHQDEMQAIYNKVLENINKKLNKL
ncbi:MAG: hypothetical protein K0R65_638 [Crocinitomicaceae bacterium]|jgi:hypothetical protein|nr:hypothetical protein [Crocinitomicaceae bacterium]